MLFAVGVVTGTILSFEFGLLWPELHGHVRRGVRRRLRARGRLVLHRGDLHRHLRLRLGPHLRRRAHFLVGIPVVHHRHHRLVHGDRGQRLDERPDRVRRRQRPRGRARSRGRRCSAATSGTSWCTCTWPATWWSGSSWPASTRARGWTGSATATTAPALVIALTFAALAAPVQLIVGDWAARTVAESQPVKLAAFEGLPRTQRARRSPSAASTRTTATVRYGIAIPKLLSLLAYHDPNARVKGLDIGAGGRPAAGEHRALLVPGDGGHRHRAGAARGRVPGHLVVAAAAARARSGSTARWSAAGPLAIVALIGGWITTEVGRQPWIVYEVMRTSQAVTAPTALEVAFVFLSWSTSAWPARSCGCCGAWRDARRRPRSPACRGGRGLMAEVCLALVVVGLSRLRGARRGRLRGRLLGPDRRRRRARRARARDGPALDEPGVGGQPRVADLRARDALDGVPGRVRLDLLDAVRSRCSWPRWGSSSAAPRSPCAARRPRSARRACWARRSRCRR